jgi:hypothetical protein
MNFKLNTLVAAALLVAAGSANAAIDNGNTTNGTGSLFLVVTDTTAGYSFVGDLGVGMDSFLGASNVSNSWTLGSFSAWTSFVGAIGGDLTNAKYSVYALDNVGATSTVDAKRLLTTVAVGDDLNNYTTANNKLGFAVNAGSATVGAWVGAVQIDSNNVLNDHDTVANGSSYTNSTKTAAYAEAQLGDQLKNNMPFVTTVAAADSADFWLLGNSSNATLAQANLYQQAGTFSLTGTTLSYAVAAVPEADTYALMLAGLGLVGFMARRRCA